MNQKLKIKTTVNNICENEYRKCKQCFINFTHYNINDAREKPFTFKECRFNRHYCFKCWKDIKNNNIKLEIINKIYGYSTPINSYEKHISWIAELCVAKKKDINKPIFLRCSNILNLINEDENDKDIYYNYKYYKYYGNNIDAKRVESIYECKSINSFDDFIDAIHKSPYWVIENKYFKDIVKKVRQITKCQITKGKYYREDGILNIAFESLGKYYNMIVDWY